MANTKLHKEAVGALIQNSFFDVEVEYVVAENAGEDVPTNNLFNIETVADIPIDDMLG